MFYVYPFSGSCVFALMNAPMFPGGLSWANLVLNMTSMAVMVCLLGASSGSMLYVYFSGYLFHHAGPASIMYLQVGKTRSLKIHIYIYIH